ncbi:hypothetical protein GQF56_06480 [Rhodobacter sphaeroides]|jgi:hypothetical protein|uniref:Uncharacterized protein n=1 Tax=Cereibacter sphaeroides (strain ATCC 17023 / DSM 158 / JCM 6121 / CCUG 31486 / LMG 2827 / NBRC 12203 / NCIMB 8253 / ATH 2.4.1.) TaxID=272943 RepID=Q3J1M3_CERS4|nr:hypothetical protein [Cereibacter sphaeroides]ABA79311.2 hypothetical protein RSP_0137 [Cereibacter sphaeroides 2.4.1]AXC61524.1 hypothetical protein DQL45_09150 [Cereibacter sphaeroides 2.4.1]MVX47517.1 hypothetical protein [Cereibacter sphaeroides]MWP38150.1 hypothetical protein [Cereibacter sphaeroides]QJC83531.1 hypothetical protein HGN32_04805 [Cereibacter sphaeroides]
MEFLDAVARLFATNGSADAAEIALRDLAAQEAMAFWAKAMFWAAVGSLGLGLVTLGTVAYTLLYTRRSLDIARDTFREAEKATEVARATLMSNRAYLVPGPVECNPGTQGITLIQSWLNTGSTPAVKAIPCAQHRVTAVGDPVPRFDLPEREEDAGDGAVGSGGKILCSELFIDARALRDASEGRAAIYIYSAVMYQDVYGRQHQAEGTRCVEVGGHIGALPRIRSAGPQNTFS